MNALNILLIDPAHPCPTEGCTRIAEMLQCCQTIRKMSLQTTTHFPPSTSSSPPHLILLRLSLEQPSIEALSALRRAWDRTPILGLFCLERAKPCRVYHTLLAGLDDFVCCPVTEMEIFPRLRRLLCENGGEDAAASIRPASSPVRFEFLVGESRNFRQIIEKIPLLAQPDAAVLILGETGTGKELVARAIHSQSSRRQKPFIPVNCGALPEHLFENELFGHAKGAFTDASSAEKGLVTEAEGGTLFLDEIDALSLASQIKLLRFLQFREYRPLGSAKSRIADVRILAATNADLWQYVQAKSFREDLYHRLNVLSLEIPPLRDRFEDILLLATHFLMLYREQYGREPMRFSPPARQNLLTYTWPGNVRELEGVVQRAVILAPTPVLEPEHIDLPSTNNGNNGYKPTSFHVAKALAIERFEQTYLVELMAEHQGNISQAAKTSGKDRRTLQRLLQKYNLRREPFVCAGH
jgi:DNA-binding NtrC family response regulator